MKAQSKTVNAKTVRMLKEPRSITAVAEMLLLLLHLSRNADSQPDSAREVQAEGTMTIDAMPIRTSRVGPRTPISVD
jgi:hypothetical protein